MVHERVSIRPRNVSFHHPTCFPSSQPLHALLRAQLQRVYMCKQYEKPWGSWGDLRPPPQGRSLSGVVMGLRPGPGSAEAASQEHETLLARWQNKNTESIIELQNKTPRLERRHAVLRTSTSTARHSGLGEELPDHPRQ